MTPPEMAISPANEAANTRAVSHSGPTKSSAGYTTKAQGTRKPAMPMRRANTPVREGSPPEMPEATKAAMATGGVMKERAP